MLAASAQHQQSCELMGKTISSVAVSADSPQLSNMNVAISRAAVTAVSADSPQLGGEWRFTTYKQSSDLESCATDDAVSDFSNGGQFIRRP